MILNIILGIVLFGSGFTLWYLISKRIPELVAIPDDVIARRLEEDSARVRVFLLRFKSFYTEGRIKEFFWSVIVKILYKMHIVLMRVDNATVLLLKRVRGSGNGSGIANGMTTSENELQKSSVLEIGSSLDKSLPKSFKIHEVRSRQNPSGGESQIV